MRFREKCREIDAYRVSSILKTENGNTVAQVGDWIAVVDGRQVVYPADQFELLYEPVCTENPALMDSAL
jgi:hypothetical protein